MISEPLRKIWRISMGDPYFETTTVQHLKSVVPDSDQFRFRCTGCGNCCRGPGSVYFSDEDMQNIQSFLGLNRTRFAALKQRLIQARENGYHVHRTGGACYFLDQDNRCAIYPVRPLQCSSFPFWPSTFASRAELEEVAADCPGTLSKAGEAHSLLQVARRVNRTRREFIAKQTNQNKLFMI